MGKPVGSDLRNGHMTLPTLLEMKRDPQLKARIESLTQMRLKMRLNYVWNKFETQNRLRFLKKLVSAICKKRMIY